MAIMKKPGASLVLVGAALFFVVSPIIGIVPLVGGVVSSVAWGVGLLGMIGGGYLLSRSIFGRGGN